VKLHSGFSRREFFGAAAASILAGVAEPLISSSAAQTQPNGRGLKIFAHWDMEGASGIFTREQAWYWENGVREHVPLEARGLFTADVNAATAAALEAGATQMIISDTHHGGGNLLLDKVLKDHRVTYNERSVGIQDGKRRWMPGLDETVAGLMLPGHHAKAFTDGAFLPHTWNLEWVDFTINGQSVGEIGIEACFAGHWDIPLILVEGDEAACYEARRQFPGVVTAVVKRDTSPDTCTGMDPDAAHRELARKVAEAVQKLRNGELRPYKPALPMTVTLRMRTMDAARKAAERPGVLRLDDHTVEARVGRQCDVVKWLLGTGLDMAM
jgi:D-amino peptidase